MSETPIPPTPIAPTVETIDQRIRRQVSDKLKSEIDKTFTGMPGIHNVPHKFTMNDTNKIKVEVYSGVLIDALRLGLYNAQIDRRVSEALCAFIDKLDKLDQEVEDLRNQINN
jgi:ribosomal protein L19